MIKLDFDTFKTVYMYSLKDYFEPLTWLYSKAKVAPKSPKPIKMIQVVDHYGDIVEDSWISECVEYYMYINNHDSRFTEVDPHYVVRDYKTAKIILVCYGTFDETLKELNDKLGNC